MSIVVQKFGGSCLSDTDGIKNAANIIAAEYKRGNSVVAVVSAQGDTTDMLIKMSRSMSLYPSEREMDVIMSVGEQLASGLLSLAVGELGLKSVSLLGWQAGILTNSVYGHARIREIHTERIKKELNGKNVVIVAGFQGVDKSGNMTTLGRGGSDTTAVALAAALDAEKCQIFSIIDGIYTADPVKVPGAKKIKEINYESMQELSFLGVQVLNPRAVELAKKYGVVIEVRSAYGASEGTFVKEDANMEKMLISGVTKRSNIAKIAVTEIEDKPGAAFGIFELLSARGIEADIITQSSGSNALVDVSFTVDGDKADEAANILRNSEKYSDNIIICDKDVAKVSVVGVGLESHHGVGLAIFEALSQHDINILMITSSELRFSVIVKKDRADEAVSAIHKRFINI